MDSKFRGNDLKVRLLIFGQLPISIIRTVGYNTEGGIVYGSCIDDDWEHCIVTMAVWESQRATRSGKEKYSGQYQGRMRARKLYEKCEMTVMAY